MDDIDLAQRNEEIFREEALARHFRRTGSETRTIPINSRNCRDCGETIPEERLRANPKAERCITCQADKEHKR